jgi:uncharacterized protein with NRDE domain
MRNANRRKKQQRKNAVHDGTVIVTFLRKRRTQIREQMPTKIEFEGTFLKYNFVFWAVLFIISK